EHRSARWDARPPALDVRANGPVAMGAVDEQQLDGPAERLQRVERVQADMANPAFDTGALQVGVEGNEVLLPLIGLRAARLREAITAGMGVDRDQFDVLRASAREHDRRPPMKAPDLDNR